MRFPLVHSWCGWGGDFRHRTEAVRSFELPQPRRAASYKVLQCFWVGTPSRRGPVFWENLHLHVVACHCHRLGTKVARVRWRRTLV